MEPLWALIMAAEKHHNHMGGETSWQSFVPWMYVDMEVFLKLGRDMLVHAGKIGFLSFAAAKQPVLVFQNMAVLKWIRPQRTVVTTATTATTSHDIRDDNPSLRWDTLPLTDLSRIDSLFHCEPAFSTFGARWLVKAKDSGKFVCLKSHLACMTAAFPEDVDYRSIIRSPTSMRILHLCWGAHKPWPCAGRLWSAHDLALDPFVVAPPTSSRLPRALPAPTVTLHPDYHPRTPPMPVAGQRISFIYSVNSMQHSPRERLMCRECAELASLRVHHTPGYRIYMEDVHTILTFWCRPDGSGRGHFEACKAGLACPFHSSPLQPWPEDVRSKGVQNHPLATFPPRLLDIITGLTASSKLAEAVAQTSGCLVVENGDLAALEILYQCATMRDQFHRVLGGW